MKFKAPGSDPIMVALLSGDTITIPNDAKGVEVPTRFRKEALARGAVPVGIDVEEEDGSKKEQKSKHQLIVEAIGKLVEEGEDEDFTGDGKPKTDPLSKVAGFTVTASERDAAWDEAKEKLGE